MLNTFIPGHQCYRSNRVIPCTTSLFLHASEISNLVWACHEFVTASHIVSGVYCKRCIITTNYGGDCWEAVLSCSPNSTHHIIRNLHMSGFSTCTKS